MKNTESKSITWSINKDGKEITIPVIHIHTLVVGSGAASLCSAERLHSRGIRDLLILTDNFRGGTSRNTGSDKQTYYKLADAGIRPDSPYDMARALSGGGCMHGDIALVEAQNSLNSFYNLVHLGVDFPHNPYGGYTGYKTDHDPQTRGVSLGPYTSKAMTEALAAEVERRSIPILDHRDVLTVLTKDDRAIGVLALNKRSLNDESFGLEVYIAENTVLGVGGPGGLYETSVYPPMHRGGIGAALEAGAEAVNLTESQFGMGSIKFRWNLSGSYQQVMPCYYSTAEDGSDRQYFLNEYFDSMEQLCHAIFLKGYQWPFDPLKIRNQGSSLIDLLVYIEREIKGRRVFMDFRINPQGSGDSFSLKQQNSEVSEYLSSSGVTAATPVERLRQFNEPAYLLYRDHGIDLETEALEIAVCAQHNNGGLAGDIWWESTNMRRLFPVGEVNGSHGVYRPGGSALNSGQVGALRAATRISRSYKESVLDMESLRDGVMEKTAVWLDRISMVLNNTSGPDVFQYRKDFQKRMTRYGGFVRSLDSARRAEMEALKQLESFSSQKLLNREQIPMALRNRQLAVAQVYYLTAIRHYLECGGGSRGSFLVLDPSGTESHPLLGDSWNFRESRTSTLIQVLKGTSSGVPDARFIPCRELPTEEYWFETMWKDYRENHL